VLKAHGMSDPGPVRKINEDGFAIEEDLQLFVVADGMGGHAAGEVASSLAIESIVGFIRRSNEDADCSWPYGIEPNLSMCGNRLRTAIHLANRRVFRAAEKYDEYTGMGTTVVSALISGNLLTVGHAGDSRLYLLSNGIITQLTVDDTWATALAADPLAERRDVSNHPMRHVLTNVIGARDHAEVHLFEHELRTGDTLLLCSDGLHNALDEDRLRELMNHNGALEDLVKQLIESALANGSRDNVTAVVVRCERPDGA
jgi:serine/threonine protein phosphatase PrpC